MAFDDTFVEIECHQCTKTGESVCGDHFQSIRIEDEDREIAVLSDGLGSGIKACLLSCMTTTMALEFVRSNMDIVTSSETIMDSLPVCEQRKISYATFTVFDVLSGGRVRVIEMDNPRFIHLRDGHDLKYDAQTLVSEKWPDRKLAVTQLRAVPGDRLICFSDGVSQAGLGFAPNKFGWTRDGALDFIRKMVDHEPSISARELSRRVVQEAKAKNPSLTYLDDASCMVVYFRKPRRLRLLTGPPFRSERDREYAELVRDFPGSTVLCGGTTANIVSRELGREVKTDLKLLRISGNLPPPAKMEGITLITEGILTLTATVKALEEGKFYDLPLAAHELVNLLVNSDQIELIVGTKVNEAHQDPNLPVDLEIRRNIVRHMKNLLEEKYRKRVSIRFY